MMDEVNNRLLDIEKKRYNILNEYIMGMVNIDKINSFGKDLESFRELVYSIETDEGNLLKIANIKSKIQHYYTEIMEDEDILQVAYNNKM